MRNSAISADQSMVSKYHKVVKGLWLSGYSRAEMSLMLGINAVVTSTSSIDFGSYSSSVSVSCKGRGVENTLTVTGFVK